MSVWTARRFWTTADVVPVDGGFSVQLDTKPVRTPLKAPLILPFLALAKAVAAEWQVQGAKVDPETMPFTRTANSAIDKVTPQFDDIADMLAAYGGSDLLCYRAGGPLELVLRQAKGWDPMLEWSESELGAPLVATTGITHVGQPAPSLAALRTLVGEQSPFQIAAFHDLVAISGSLVLSFAVTRGRIDAEEAWALSRIDEDWQAERWGSDEEATEMAVRKRAAFLQADRFYGLCG